MSSEENTTQEVDSTTEEVVDTTVEDTVEETELSPADLKKMVEKLRRENAKRRVSEKEVNDKLKEYDDWKKSQLSEVDRLKQEAAEAKQEAEEIRTERRRDRVARKYEIDDDLAEFLGTGSEEDMTERAKKLSKVNESSSSNGTGTSNSGLFGETRGTPVNAGSSTGWLSDMFNNSD